MHVALHRFSIPTLDELPFQELAAGWGSVALIPCLDSGQPLMESLSPSASREDASRSPRPCRRSRG
jgi:hypothetical protein